MLEDHLIQLLLKQSRKAYNIIQDGKTVFKYAVTNMADASDLF
jgi:hypothetical protein